MSTTGIVIIAVGAIILLWAIVVFNRFKRLKVQIAEAWSGIDVQLKRKVNILTNLLDVLKMQMTFENNLLTELSKARSGLLAQDHEVAMSANDKLTQLLSSITATAEAYPNLGTNQSYLRMMSDIRDCEDKVTYARTRYNMVVSDFNAGISVFPSNIIAGLMKCSPEKMFEISEPPREIADNLRIGKM